MTHPDPASAMGPYEDAIESIRRAGVIEARRACGPSMRIVSDLLGGVDVEVVHVRDTAVSIWIPGTTESGRRSVDDEIAGVGDPVLRSGLEAAVRRIREICLRTETGPIHHVLGTMDSASDEFVHGPIPDECGPPPSIRIGETMRGFAIGRFIDRYAADCSIQESSLASEAAIWLGTDEQRMHLTQPQAAVLIPLLAHFVRDGTLPRPAPTDPL